MLLLRVPASFRGYRAKRRLAPCLESDRIAFAGDCHWLRPALRRQARERRERRERAHLPRWLKCSGPSRPGADARPRSESHPDSETRTLGESGVSASGITDPRPTWRSLAPESATPPPQPQEDRKHIRWGK